MARISKQKRRPKTSRIASSDKSFLNKKETDFSILPEQFLVDPRTIGCEDKWSWSATDKSPEVRLKGKNQTTAYFHPQWSFGASGVRGERALDFRRFYWELDISPRIFGTSIMFGVATRSARLHVNKFTNLLGEDANGWGFSHKGLLWHNGCWSKLMYPFRENVATTIGLMYDGAAGTLSYYKDGVCLGIAFRNVKKIGEPLYPFVCSTVTKTKMSVRNMRVEFISLRDLCRNAIVRPIKTKQRLSELKIPPAITEYIQAALPGEEDRTFYPEHLSQIIDY